MLITDQEDVPAELVHSITNADFVQKDIHNLHVSKEDPDKLSWLFDSSKILGKTSKKLIVNIWSKIQALVFNQIDDGQRFKVKNFLKFTGGEAVETVFRQLQRQTLSIAVQNASRSENQNLINFRRFHTFFRNMSLP